MPRGFRVQVHGTRGQLLSLERDEVFYLQMSTEAAQQLLGELDQAVRRARMLQETSAVMPPSLHFAKTERGVYCTKPSCGLLFKDPVHLRHAGANDGADPVAGMTNEDLERINVRRREQGYPEVTR